MSEQVEPATDKPLPTECPCGSELKLVACCGRYIHGDEQPDTAEALMRSRYTAYVLADVDYIISTHSADDEETEVDRSGTERWAKESTWQGLEIVSTKDGSKDDEEGEVEFIASYSGKDGETQHHEIAQFARQEGRWLYMSGEPAKPETVVREAPKIGRNEPCPCGSGKKYKKCCEP